MGMKMNLQFYFSSTIALNALCYNRSNDYGTAYFFIYISF